jgi:hypothetical protein
MLTTICPICNIPLLEMPDERICGICGLRFELKPNHDPRGEDITSTVPLSGLPVNSLQGDHPYSKRGELRCEKCERFMLVEEDFPACFDGYLAEKLTLDQMLYGCQLFFDKAFYMEEGEK